MYVCFARIRLYRHVVGNRFGTKFAILIHVLNMIADRARIKIDSRTICAYYIFQKFRSRARTNANPLFLAKATERTGCIFIISRYHSATGATA